MTDDAADRLLSDAPAPEIEVRESEVIAHGAVWDVRRDRFAFGETELVRDYVDHTGVAAVLGIDDEDRVLLLRQYRHPIGARDWEIVAGLMDVDGESALTGAQRELAEEADLAADRWDLLADVCSSPGGSTEAVRIFLARDLRPVAHDYVREGEEAEIEVRWVPLDDAVAAVLAGRLQNSTTMIAVLTAAASRAAGWSTLRPADAPWDRRAAVRGERSRTRT